MSSLQIRTTISIISGRKTFFYIMPIYPIKFRNQTGADQFGFITYFVIYNVNIDVIPKSSVFNTSRLGRLDVDWSVENMTPDMYIVYCFKCYKTQLNEIFSDTCIYK